MLWCTKLQFLKDIHNYSRTSKYPLIVVMMYKVTIFERYTQPGLLSSFAYACCYDVQSYNFWKIYTTLISKLKNNQKLLWCTKLQFLKDIHNWFSAPRPPIVVVMMYKVTIFERYTQQGTRRPRRWSCCYDVQSYNFWKIYTTSDLRYSWLTELLWCTKLQFLKDIHNRIFSSEWMTLLLWCTKLQFLKDIHNTISSRIPIDEVVMMYKVTIFERYTQHVFLYIYGTQSCYDVQSYNFWKIYTTSLSS